MGDRGEDGTQRLDPHGDVQEVGSKEEVVVVPEEGHHHVPAQVQEGLWAHRVGGREHVGVRGEHSGEQDVQGVQEHSRGWECSGGPSAISG